jgi:peptide/nickel transport system permease protein
MFAFILSRILQAIPVLLVVGFIAFAMFAYIGDPVTIMLGQDYTEAQRVALVHQLGLDQPFFVQYLHFVWAALHGNFGISFRLAQPVAALIAERLPATLELAITASVLAFIIGVPMGVYTGIYRDSWMSRGFMVVSLVGVSLPTFLLGILLILVFAVALGWLPSFGRGPVVPIGGWWTTGFTSWAGIRALILPAVTLGMFQMTLIMRLVRAEMLEVLRSDYIKFARARGLSNRAINFGHALKNTLVPVITIIGLQFGGIVAFSLVTETVFQWPGVGLLLAQSVAVADIPVMSAYLLMIALLFVMINLVVDLLYYAVDPRLRVNRGSGRAR